MLTILFIILMIAVFGKIIALAIKAAWGITKIVFGIILLPIALIVLAVSGLIVVALPILLVVGLLVLLIPAKP